MTANIGLLRPTWGTWGGPRVSTRLRPHEIACDVSLPRQEPSQALKGLAETRRAFLFAPVEFPRGSAADGDRLSSPRQDQPMIVRCAPLARIAFLEPADVGF